MTTTELVYTTALVPSALVRHDENDFEPVARGHHSKTLDFGHQGTTVSAGLVGDILQLSCFHPKHGMVVACPFAQFDGDRFYDSDYVRKYRTTLLDYVRSDMRGFGVQFDGSISNLKIGYLANKWPLISYSIGEALITTTLFIGDCGSVVQSTNIKSTSTKSLSVDYSLALAVSVNRASYGQLTEGGPIPIPVLRNELKLSDNGRTWAVINPNLDASVQGSLYLDGVAISLESGVKETIALGAPINATFNGTINLHPKQSSSITSTFQLHSGSSVSKLKPAPQLANYKGGWKIKHDTSGLIIKRNLAYILGNCTVPVGKDSTCFITDHVALPLGWNRDNYWQIRFLLDVHKNMDRIAHRTTALEYRTQIKTAVRQHLNWVFRLAQRPHGYWHRSYLATGVPKDGPVFQQDQQCYPLLELCDFLESFPSQSTFVESILVEDTIPSILSALKAKQDPITGLFSTDETPGDDAVDHPFHFSSHILLWHTLSRLSDLLSSLSTHSHLNPNLDAKELRNQASQIRTAILKHFVAHNPATGTTMFAYLTNGADIHTFYHDANDLPTLLMRDWHFLSSPAEEALWKRTMDFALSPQNEGGYYAAGAFGGLGSIHTRGPWPLGYAQEFIYANLTASTAAIDDAWRRIHGSMFSDGLFSEAVDAETGNCISKAWFSWPGSIIGSALLRFGAPPLVT